MFPLSEKSKVLVLIKKKKKHAEVAKIYRKNKSSIHEIMKNEKEFIFVLLLHLILQKLWS